VGTSTIFGVEVRYLNWVLAGLILLTNLHFLPLSYQMVRSAGGPMGYGLLGVPILLVATILLIPAGLTFTRVGRKSRVLLLINALGVLWNVRWLFILLTPLRQY
jgi:hypothetical protein